MRRLLWLAGVAFAAGFALGNTGCASASSNAIKPRTSSPTFALAVTVNGGTQPSAEQWNVLRTTFTEMLGKRGYQLVDNATHASNIIHVNFVTPAGNPLVGSAVVLSIEQLPSAIPSGYPGMGSYGKRRVSLASFDPALAADHTVYLTSKDETGAPVPSPNPDAAAASAQL